MFFLPNFIILSQCTTNWDILSLKLKYWNSKHDEIFEADYISFQVVRS